MASASHVADVYNARRYIVEEQRGWNFAVALVASDSGASFALRILDGRICDLVAGSGQADVVITADASTLRDVFLMRKNPNDPYIFGELTVCGPEADFLRIGYIAAVLCPT